MPTIPNFPQNLLDEHKNWHHARHAINIGNPPSGYGLDFLRFHRSFISRALAWYKAQGLDPALVEAWASVPEPIRQAPCYDPAAEARILFQPESFASADELGRFIESSNIHGCIHQEAAQLYGNPEINDFDLAPRNTIFYNIHGMVDRWWRNWEGLGRFHEPRTYWCGSFSTAEDEVLYYEGVNGRWWLGQYRNIEPNGPVDVVWEWEIIGDSTEFGPMDDGRHFRIWDTDGDGKLEVLFRDPVNGSWIEGKIKDGHLNWQSVLIQLSV